MTPERLEQIEKRCNAATAGPWSVARYTNYLGYSIFADPPTGCIAERWYDNEQQAPYKEQIGGNAQFIAHARTDIPDLLSEIKRLRGELNSNLRKFIDYPNDPFYKFHPDYGWLAKDTCESITEDVGQLRAQLSDAQAALKVSQDALREHAVYHSSGFVYCCACHYAPPNHSPGCAIAAALQPRRE
jgi:hypothetical protein